MLVKITTLTPTAKVPTYASLGAAGFDFYSNETVQVCYGQPQIIGTGVAIEVPQGHCLLLFSRSGHGFNHNVRLSNGTGVIDSDYRGEIKVKLAMDFPSWQNTLNVEVGDRIAQGFIVPVPKIEFVPVNFTELSQTKRGEEGLGSTGVK